MHRGAVVNLQKASTDGNDSLRIYLAKQRVFDGKAFGFITEGKAFYPRFPSSTSWNAAKSTAIIAEFDYEVVEALTDVYDAQEIFVKETFSYIIQTVYNPTSDDERDTINALLLQISELTSQEEFVLSKIEEALKVIGGEKPAI